MPKNGLQNLHFSFYQSTVEFCIKACVNKFCVRPWQAHHKGLFTDEPLLTFSSH